MNIMSRFSGEAAVLSDSKVPTIGFLTESLNSLYQSNIWIGASDTAMRLGYSLICFAGGSLHKSSWNEYEPQRNAIYSFLDKNRLAGLVIAGSLGNFITSSEFKDFYNRFIDIPLVCLGPEIPSVPTVIVDNIHGMRQLISHLVETHNCKDIAFVRGPEGNQEAEERLKIFQEVLTEHGITPDEKLIMKGDFSRDAGIHAVEYLLKNELHFDALVGANDDTALGALKAFQEHHIRVPEEVLVFGFDDIEESSFSAPPLTTVRQPLYEIGSKSIEVIHNCIQGSKIKGTIIVPATLVTRQSCGCFRNHEVDGKLFVAEEGSSSTDDERLLRSEVEKAILKMLIHTTEHFDTSLIDELVSAFIDESTLAQSGRFLPAMHKISWKIAGLGGDTLGMFHVLSIMRKFIGKTNSGVLPEHCELLFQNGYIAIMDAANRTQANRRLSSERRATILRAAGQAVASAFDIEKLLEVIAQELVNLEIDECYLSLYRGSDPLRNAEVLQLVMALKGGERVLFDKSECMFEAPNLVPNGLLSPDSPSSLIVEPLYFRDEQIGILLFEVRRCRNGLTYEILQQHISSALKGALLMKKVQEQSVALEQANVQLQKLRDAEHAYLEAIKHELELGREIQTSFLPRSIPKVDGWEMVTAFQPAREVSGDFYDIFVLPDGKVIVIICDVSGKDVSAALYMALIRTLLRALSEQALAGAAHPLDAVEMTNRYLINHHYGSNGRYMYATLFMAMLDPVNYTVDYVNAGHNPPCIINSGAIRQWIKTTGPAVGIIPEAEFGKVTFSLNEGEILFLYTDGITEARSPDGELFSKARLIEILNKKVATADELLNTVNTAVKIHTKDTLPFDDITMIAVRNESSQR